MFEIELKDNEVILSGRFDASQVEKGRETFAKIKTSYTVDCKDLEYISSAGLSILLVTQKRLCEQGHSLQLKNMSKHINDIFIYAGFDQIFNIV